jgi:T5orf172 domain
MSKIGKSSLSSLGISDDPFGLLAQPKKNVSSPKIQDLLVDAFEEICDFIESNSREPQKNADSIVEFQLFSRLKSIRESPGKVKALRKYDFLNILSDSPTTDPDLTDIVGSDEFGLLKTSADNSIFKLQHVKAPVRISPEYLSRRKVCRDFSDFQPLFNVIHDELESKERLLARFRPESLVPGSFHVLNGLLLYIDSVDGLNTTHSFESGQRIRFDGRTRIIFENGTESDMLFRSLEKAMHVDGYDFTDKITHDKSTSIAQEEDVLFGYIYVLRSNATSEWNHRNLYKIGHTTSTVLERIKNAKSQSTYLFNDVTVVSTYRCLNISSTHVEKALHGFFAPVRLDIELTDPTGNSYYPREWFIVDVNVLDEAIMLFLENRLESYFYESKNNQIVAK